MYVSSGIRYLRRRAITADRSGLSEREIVLTVNESSGEILGNGAETADEQLRIEHGYGSSVGLTDSQGPARVMSGIRRLLELFGSHAYGFRTLNKALFKYSLSFLIQRVVTSPSRSSLCVLDLAILILVIIIVCDSI